MEFLIVQTASHHDRMGSLTGAENSRKLTDGCIPHPYLHSTPKRSAQPEGPEASPATLDNGALRRSAALAGLRPALRHPSARGIGLARPSSGTTLRPEGV